METLQLSPLSELVQTGIPYGYLILIRGDLGMGKTLMVKRIAREILSKYPVLYITFDDDPNSIKDELSEYASRLFIVDGFNLGETTGRVMPNVVGNITELDPRQLINVMMSTLPQTKARGVIIDSVNDMLMNVDPRSLLFLLKEIKMITRRYNAVGVIVAHTTTEDLSGMIDNMEYVFDGIIEIELDPNLAQLGVPVRRLRIKRLKGTAHSIDWFYFTISKGNMMPINIDDIKKALSTTLNMQGER
ncbi:RAD55 family ATPase [Caldivirga maquilingensis]|uniref:AAA ATPase n=1 Tax=Caldivirga maquilingensis (strain ATCC 700844 / DSM 13496 / JCM 10307 / IC-167) TaxID=397948 RepID=A8MBC8_CALMQ|nr:RAD55 family ATPase [Caldivirga maquilingensis]ABW01218.1 AAA ATPase [Caldivirga maquilingensis IC-167]